MHIAIHSTFAYKSSSEQRCAHSSNEIYIHEYIFGAVFAKLIAPKYYTKCSTMNANSIFFSR